MPGGRHAHAQPPLAQGRGRCDGLCVPRGARRAPLSGAPCRGCARHLLVNVICRNAALGRRRWCARRHTSARTPAHTRSARRGPRLSPRVAVTVPRGALPARYLVGTRPRPTGPSSASTSASSTTNATSTSSRSGSRRRRSRPTAGATRTAPFSIPTWRPLRSPSRTPPCRPPVRKERVRARGTARDACGARGTRHACPMYSLLLLLLLCCATVAARACADTQRWECGP